MTKNSRGGQGRFAHEPGAAAAAGRKSAEARAQRQQRDQDLRARFAEAVAEVAGADVGRLAELALADLLLRLAGREIPVRSGGEAATLARELHTMIRLESGQPTSLTLTASIGPDAVLERARQLRGAVLETFKAQPALEAASRDTPANTNPEQEPTGADDTDADHEPGTRRQT